ncbi:hypothetical protein PHAVU_010G132100 [Phaseolus vulgaris]|uniref:Uncharacterized protein n=1 Tax=Phaseolus vulgaris TaxID=3885 RepID=V7AS63_PHAVU|nr:hypothetical protein PHAVU_010G132100g [Phaseolus vulgaris]ESW07463.1 hypothetical protein PHAVU_010G132100g [Phaseolus vulgaris]
MKAESVNSSYKTCFAESILRKKLFQLIFPQRNLHNLHPSAENSEILIPAQIHTSDNPHPEQKKNNSISNYLQRIKAFRYIRKLRSLSPSNSVTFDAASLTNTTTIDVAVQLVFDTGKCCY